MRGLIPAWVATALLCAPAWGQTGPLRIVAAENFYGDVAHQLAGPRASVVSILSNPDEDPHLFEASPSVARNLSSAQIVACNGADYDPWMEKLLDSARATHRQTIVVADLVHRHAGDNPHLWYDPATMPAFSRALEADLAAADPAHRDDYARRLDIFVASLRPLDERIAALRRKYAGQPVTASEPVFGYMAAALGLVMRNEGFQLSVMNDTEPAASDVAAFERDLRRHAVRVMIYNSQAADPAVQRLLAVAKQSGVPVTGVTETEPPGKDYQHWMLDQLDALDRAMSHPAS